MLRTYKEDTIFGETDAMEFRVLCIYVWALGMVVFLGMVVWSLILGVDLYNLRPRFNSVRVVQWCLVQRWRNLVMPYREVHAVWCNCNCARCLLCRGI